MSAARLSVAFGGGALVIEYEDDPDRISAQDAPPWRPWTIVIDAAEADLDAAEMRAWVRFAEEAPTSRGMFAGAEVRVRGEARGPGVILATTHRYGKCGRGQVITTQEPTALVVRIVDARGELARAELLWPDVRWACAVLRPWLEL